MTLGHRLESVHSMENHATSGAHWSPVTRTRTPGAEEHLLPEFMRADVQTAETNLEPQTPGWWVPLGRRQAVGKNTH